MGDVAEEDVIFHGIDIYVLVRVQVHRSDNSQFGNRREHQKKYKQQTFSNDGL